MIKLKKILQKIRLRTWIGLGLILVLLPIVALRLYKPDPTNAVWLSYDWGYRKTITINESQVPGSTDMANFPALVSLVDSDLQANALASGDDIIFTDSTGIQLAHEIESYTSGSGTLVAWVLVPTLSAANNTEIYMYYGNSGASNTEDPDTLWADYEAVYHFSGDVLDSTINSRDGTDSGTADIAGKVGQARDFEDSESDYVDIGTWSVSGDQMTTQFWVQFNAFPGGVDGRVISKSTSSAEQGHVIMLGYTDNGSFDIRTRIKTGTDDGSGTTTLVGDSNWTTSTWYHATVTYDGTNIRLFVNGSQVTSTPKTGNLRENTYSWNIGRNAGSNDSYVDAIIDEPRVASIYRNSDWLTAEYNNQNSPSGFYSITAEESAPSPVTNAIELYFPFNEEAGSTAHDGSGEGSDGAISGATHTDPTQCKYYFCLSFDGADDVVTAGSHVGISFADDLAGAHTFMGWVKPLSDGESSVGQIFSKGNTYMRTTNNADGYVDLEVSLDLTTDDATVTVTDGLRIGEWSHVAYTYTDDGDDEVTVYINGRVLGTSINGSGTPITTDINPLSIGGSSGANYHGLIDEFKVYSGERTANEIASDMISESPEGASAAFGTDPYSFLSKNLMGYWKMDEATDADRLDTSGNATTLTESATDSVVAAVGKFHNAADFELGDTEYLSAADNSALSITGSLTLAAWIRPETVSAGSYNIIAKWDGANESYRLFQNGDEIRLELDSAGNYQETSAANLAVSTYYHVAGVYDSTSQTARIYINGVETASTTTGTIPASIGDDAGVFHIGAEDSTGGATGYYDGYIDEARVYNRALSGSEIQRLYNWAPGPFAYYRLDKTSTTETIVDSSGNNNSGTGENFATTDWVQGKYGGALTFDGSDNAIDMYSTGFSDDFNGNSGTLAAWIKVRNANVWTDGSYRQIFHFVPSNVDRFEIAKSSVSNDLRFYFRTNSSDIVAYDYSTAETDWFHVALTWDNPNGHVIAYINGEQIFNNDGAWTAWVTPLLDEWTTIGAARSDAPTQAFNGYIDDVRVYNYPRTNGQIIEDMNGGHPLGGSPIGSQTIFWKFDEAQGATAYNDVDLGTDGTVANALWKSKANCKINGCLQFDGTGDVVTIATASDSNVDFDAGEAFSGSAWVYSTTLPASGDQDAIIAKWEHDGSTDQRAYRMFMDGDSTSSHFGIEIYDESANQVISAVASDNTAAVNTWYHVAFTFNGGAAGAAGDLKLYVNGNHVASNTANGSFLGIEGGTTADFTVGDYDSDDSQATNTGFTGFIDDVKIYSDDLTAPQILIDMNANSVSSFGSTALGESTQVVDGAGNPPVGKWSFDENKNYTCSGGSNDACDTSENSNDLIMTNGPTWDLGKYGSAIRFDGSNDYVSVNHNSVLSLGDNMTLEAWIKPDSVSIDDQLFLHKGSTGDWSARAYSLVLDQDEIYVSYLNGSGWQSFATSTANIAANTWSHIVYTRDGTTERIYVNGMISNQGTVTQLMSDNTLPFVIGSMPPSTAPSEKFDGAIDEVIIYNYARTPAQVAYDYNRGDPVGWWKMDECTGTTVYDSSGNAMTGTIEPGDATGSNDSVGTCAGSAGEMRADGASGKYNSSIEFDGTNDYINLGNQSLLRDFYQLTVSAWIYGTSLPSSDLDVVFYKDTSGFYLGVFDRKIRFRSSDLTSDSTTSSTTISNNQWHHIAATYDGTTVKLYLNGKLDGSEPATGTISENTLSSTIGAFGSSSQFFTGKIDDVRVYKYALSSSQIQKLVNENSGGRFGPVSGTP